MSRPLAWSTTALELVAPASSAADRRVLSYRDALARETPLTAASREAAGTAAGSSALGFVPYRVSVTSTPSRLCTSVAEQRMP